MVTYAVVKTGGKQYLVKVGMMLTVDQLDVSKKEKKIELETLLKFDEEGKAFELGQPVLKEKVIAEVVGNVKGDKIRIAKFKAKSRYRKVRGFRARLTKLKIIKV
ncbi:MAG: 50S ribosomal protein L21 [Patescibacteria group bacterium]